MCSLRRGGTIFVIFLQNKLLTNYLGNGTGYATIQLTQDSLNKKGHPKANHKQGQ